LTPRQALSTIEPGVLSAVAQPHPQGSVFVYGLRRPELAHSPRCPVNRDPLYLTQQVQQRLHARINVETGSDVNLDLRLSVATIAPNESRTAGFGDSDDAVYANVDNICDAHLPPRKIINANVTIPRGTYRYRSSRNVANPVATLARCAS
jgi:hypothetical protein